MNKLNKRNVFERGMEIFAWLQAYAPNIPVGQPTTMEAQFIKLKDVINLASDYVQSDDAKRYLVFCMDDLTKAEAKYQTKECADSLMDSAKHWFEEARKDKKSKPTFIVGPEGQASQASDIDIAG
mgnify:CR=1 FL=1